MNVNSSSNRGEAILAALKTQFPGAVLDEERQTPEQVTITVKINLLPDVVHYLYYQHDGWLPRNGPRGREPSESQEPNLRIHTVSLL